MNHCEHLILIVDDNPITSEILLTFLLEQGYRAEVVNDSRKVLDYLCERDCDLVLMDIMMPHLSGIELCRLLKADPRTEEIPVIFITSNHDGRLLTEAFRSGGVDYLTNPYIYEELLARIDTHLRLRRSERQLKNQLALRELMLTSLAHDLRGPIGTGALILERVLNSEGSLDQCRPVIESAAYSIRKTYQLLQDMLSWAQAINRALPFRPEEVELGEVVQECLDQCQLRAREKQVKLCLDADLGQRIYADANLLRSILSNLLGNAIKFSPLASIVTLRAVLAPTAVELQVIDNGSGMSPELVAKLEQQLPVISRPGTAGEYGSGMGIKICQAFAHRHGGRILISSEPGQGSCFTLIVPQPDLATMRELQGGAIGEIQDETQATPLI
jgi:signal transduction histidine kinase